MTKCKKIRELFDEEFCEELNKEQETLLENHLRECPACRAAYNDMTSMLLFMKKRVRVEPGPDFWDGYQARLMDRMEKEDVPVSKPGKKQVTFFHALIPGPRWAYQALAAVVLVVIGIFLGRELFPPAPPARSDKRMGPMGPPFVAAKLEPGSELMNHTRDFIERSKVLLLAIINFDPETEDAYVLNLPYQQEVSKKLLRRAGWIKNEFAAVKGLPPLHHKRYRQLRELVADLEIILLQVANLESGADISTIELVKNGVKIRGVLFKIQLTDIRQFINKKNKSTTM
jgi:hypothetical protein